jgi:hypothetical protein
MMFPARPLLAAALLVPLLACSNAPQQPSDTVDDKAAESPRLGDETHDAALDSAEFETDLTAPEAEPATPPLSDPIVTGALQASAPDLAAVSGRWASDLAACEGDSSAVIIISPTHFEAPGRTCSVGDLIDGGDGSVTATLSCPMGAADETQSELVKLNPADGNLTLSFVGGAQPSQILSRCP